MDNAFSCSSHDLLELERQASRHGTSLFPCQEGTCRHESRGGCAAIMWEKRAPRKAVQTFSFDGAPPHHRSSHGTFHSGVAGSSLKSSCVAHAAREYGGSRCATYHRGPHCFPTPRYREALSRQRHDAGARGGGLVCGCDGALCCAAKTLDVLSSTAPSTQAEDDLWLLWSAVPHHLLMQLIHTPQDAEVLLARLREEQHLLENSDINETVHYERR
ncbi:hypothetical protein LSCM1_00381 [Leishmania martiniquensis]|uniref:Uncharacterized protein n=1 Tax=Leishmania martiniquensis TaxID=1580590 RepID=A0A836GSJ4_9TRYP|nr:hypothetical protein LSCM1_00381 [Leishmania martiniquensis]